VNEDFLDMLRALSAEGARFLVVGAHALAGHGVPRATGDLDIWVEPSVENVPRIWRALLAFGAPVQSLGVSAEDFAVPGNVIQLGLPPRRIDLMTRITGVDFEAAWMSRSEVMIDGVAVPILGRQALIANKRAVGRPQDLADVDALRRSV
jgi:hypothetical protein